MKPQCGNCEFARGPAPLECHRHAPLPTDKSVFAVWMKVQPYDWCGEFEPVQPEAVDPPCLTFRCYQCGTQLVVMASQGQTAHLSTCPKCCR